MSWSRTVRNPVGRSSPYRRFQTRSSTARRRMLRSLSTRSSASHESRRAAPVVGQELDIDLIGNTYLPRRGFSEHDFSSRVSRHSLGKFPPDTAPAASPSRIVLNGSVLRVADPAVHDPAPGPRRITYWSLEMLQVTQVRKRRVVRGGDGPRHHLRKTGWKAVRVNAYRYVVVITRPAPDSSTALSRGTVDRDWRLSWNGGSHLRNRCWSESIEPGCRSAR